MGKTVTLGRACALVAVVLMGPNIPFEEAGHEERLCIFKSAAYYALTDTDEELEDIFDTEDALMQHFGFSSRDSFRLNAGWSSMWRLKQRGMSLKTLFSALQARTRLFRSIWG